MQTESFQSLPLQAVIPSYLYQEYSDDEDLQAFVASYNTITQGYLDWFNQTPLSVYTSDNISGSLLDWIGQGIYGMPRPVLASSQVIIEAGYDEQAYDTVPYNYLAYSASGTATTANDDIYKRVLTWNLYKGDGQVFCLQWLKNRIARFINGVAGSDFDVLDSEPSITVSAGVFTVSYFASQIYSDLQLAYANGALAFPFQYTMSFANVVFSNVSGALHLPMALNYPSSATGLAPGSVWYDGGSIGVVAGITPNPTAPAVLYGSITPDALRALGGGNLPLTDPHVVNHLWNNAGVIAISAG